MKRQGQCGGAEETVYAQVQSPIMLDIDYSTGGPEGTHAQWGEGRSCQQVAQRTLGEVVARSKERGNQGQGMYCIIHAFSFNT